MIQMVFFDIGDVLFDETPQHSWLFHALLLTLRAHGKDVLWDDFNATRKQLAARGPNPEAAIKGTLAAYCANDSETEVLWHEARDTYQQMRKPRPFGLLLDGITPVLRDLRRDFRLGIIANQHPPVAQAVADYGLAPLFDVVVISEIVHLFKPDPAIFRYALDEAGVAPPQAVFVGDRPDNDIGPAKAAGMRTVRFRRGIQYVHYNPDDPALTADETVTDVSELAAAVRRVAGSKGP
ncbi:MAG: HAD family hydrolase [Armatimonadetes bacterium]|nr:HAD family hydrolase [Armatimonadota bacterium]